ncbi:hypothetical protein EKN56_05615 [Limnobaculum zhutongyuii]|uniref:Elongation factor Tu n=1 Tax=Limnobaculum zhutongyuii TaxID=2498113 RepID=A0A411WIB3_9GAMM|nr:hypothetical protein [Limnobaculum zhutongyuii]QBH95925.1 hypothetical protein EKN56_05615 [Limnobaculum zhutongyuii]TQS89366.1 hypothetical protein ELQ32_06315 [Limnobaculum zhutongyuii]
MGLQDHGPDAEVIFRFNGTRKGPAYSGYRPDHLIKDDYLTCGKHEYIEPIIALPNSEVLGTITFMSPSSYPHCLWPGKIITFQEGPHITGTVEIINILNPLLDAQRQD